MRTLTQKLLLPLTLNGLTCGGRTNAPLPSREKAFVLSAKPAPLIGPLFVVVPNSIQDPFQTSQRSLRSSDGLAGRGVCTAPPGGLVTVTISVTLAPALEKASSRASHRVSLNLGFSPNG